MVKEWINCCLSEHSSCRQSRSWSLPSRVIDVAWGEPVNKARLVVSANINRASYAALSYCWGDHQPERLTQANLKQKQSNIRFGELGKTIQDAIEITRELGLQYLWVDSQCIVQDSLEDWQRESANMADVYANALITIQASGASHSRVGCFIARPESAAPAMLKFTTDDESQGYVFVRPQEISHQKDEELAKRGWTLQESLLATRILSYGTDQISWECTEAFWSEAGIPAASDMDFLGLPKPMRAFRKPAELPPDVREEDDAVKLAVTWSHIVQDYTRRRLTFGEDKLPAISGIAKHMLRTRPGDTYLAGIWRNDMPVFLLWAPTNNARRPASYRAPSWSWASVDGQVSILEGFNDSSRSIHCQVLEAGTTRAGLDPLGGVSSGYLRLRGPLKQAWRMIDQLNHKGVPEEDVVQFLYPTDSPLLPSDRPFLLKLGLCQVDIADVKQSFGQFIPTCCFRITDTNALALRQKPDGTFERVGIIILDDQKTVWFDNGEVRLITVV